ncbi:MAG TPA: sterol desaturase family protein [Blastocatellia bacterium]|nr:sterol desaturase family protein [Blastocatellia bacterium]
MFRKLLNFVAAPLAIAGFGLLLLAESRRPLRKAASDKLQRMKTNIGIAGVTSIAINLLFIPVVSAVARFAQQRKLGLLNSTRLPEPVRFVAGLALFDYTFYWWHRWMHESSFLWRFHAAHHTDLELDVSTSARFHFGEYVLSTPYRAAQVIVIGASPAAAAVFETIMMIAAEFHHSNVRLPVETERRLNSMIVTPRMHGIHHSIIEAESKSNFATVLSVWDMLHGTLKLNVPQDEIKIGLASYRDEDELRFANLLALPFNRQRESWSLPDGSRPVRALLSEPEKKLVN